MNHQLTRGNNMILALTKLILQIVAAIALAGLVVSLGYLTIMTVGNIILIKFFGG